MFKKLQNIKITQGCVINRESWDTRYILSWKSFEIELLSSTRRFDCLEFALLALPLSFYFNYN